MTDAAIERVAMPRLLIAGTSSGVGKTTFTAGLCHALRRRGLSVATFKCGPDYLDPTYHRIASGRACHNLDGFMMGRQVVRRTFARNAVSADIALIEGMMGLFDGASATSLESSSAEIAQWLDAPVILICDASAMARSLAALVHGFASFEPSVRLAGVICNRVGGAGHRALLEAACTSVPVLGGLIAETTHAFPERHLGLRSARELGDAGWLDAWADRIEAQCDVTRLIALANAAQPLACEPETRAAEQTHCRIAVAHDEAFHFYYDENLRLLEAHGAQLVFFSPLRDACVPDADGLYIGGGYPELHAAALASNSAMLASLRAFADAGKPVLAECGGLMYLAGAIVTAAFGDEHAERHEMVGLIEGTAVVHEKLQAIGYVQVETARATWLGPAGTRARGHQFRYSRLEGRAQPSLYEMRTPAAQVIGTEGYGSRSVLASYVHLCFASNPKLAQAFVRACSVHFSSS